MNRNINFKELTIVNCTMEFDSKLGSLLIKSSENGGALQLCGQPMKLGGVDWSSQKYLVLEVTNHEEWIQGVVFQFFTEKNTSYNADMLIIMGVLPGVKTTLSLPFSILDAQTLFIPRTPGKLKTIVLGNKLELDKVNRLMIGTMKSFTEQRLEITKLYLSENEPEYELPDIKLVDELGQSLVKEWTGKTNSEEELKEFLQNELTASEERKQYWENWDSFGGWKKKKFKATGYFRTQHDGKRWWLIDPDGCVFYSTGVDCVHPGETSRISQIEKFFSWLSSEEGDFAEAWNEQDGAWGGKYFNFGISNFIRAFGQKWRESWSKITRNRLVKWGFNTVGNWSALDFPRNAEIPYVWPLKDFPQTEKRVFRDFPDVFSPEYSRKAEEFALQLKEFTEDKYLIGYFLRNEPQWAFIGDLNIAEELLENPEDLASKDKLIEFLSEKYNGDIQELNCAWNLNLIGFLDLKTPVKRAASLSEQAEKDLIAFSGLMIDRYVRVPSEAAKKVDPNHLNLGMRYAFISNDVLYSGSDCFDVFSINCYKMNPVDEIEKVGERTGLPVMIGEFHFGALDAGLMSTGLRGVTSQRERGKAFKYYVENAAASVYCVGTHYFILNDQGLLGRFDGENMQIGCIDVCGKPYYDFIEGIIDTNKTLYEVAEGLKRSTTVMAEEIERVGF